MMYFKLHDSDESIRRREGAQQIPFRELEHWNRRGYGIFQTLQDYEPQRRLKENIRNINAWYIEVDDKSKEEQEEIISRSPLVPSLIVESKRSYHVYWWAQDGTRSTWEAIVHDRLQPFFQSDMNARDETRILRVAGFFHLKHPNAPFRVRLVHSLDVKYTELQMLQAFEDQGSAARLEKEAKAQARLAARSIGDLTAVGLFERAFQLDCRTALLRLSGTPAVGGEVIALKENRSGTANIIVDGKSTSCWVDVNGKIGSNKRGGPGIAQWVNWYHGDYRRTRQHLLDAFPEIGEDSV